MAAETHVALLIDVDAQGIPSRDHDPHAYVKLST